MVLYLSALIVLLSSKCEKQMIFEKNLPVCFTSTQKENQNMEGRIPDTFLRNFPHQSSSLLIWHVDIPKPNADTVCSVETVQTTTSKLCHVLLYKQLQ